MNSNLGATRVTTRPTERTRYAGIVKSDDLRIGIDQKFTEPVHVGRVATRMCEVQHIKALQKLLSKIENLKSKES